MNDYSERGLTGILPRECHHHWESAVSPEQAGNTVGLGHGDWGRARAIKGENN